MIKPKMKKKILKSNDPQFALIFNYSTAMRKAIEREKNNIELFGNVIKDFPFGCCNVASIVLGIYLSKKEIVTNYICGIREDGSHGWLDYNGLIIDISADQYVEIVEPVIVTYKSHFHKTFRQYGKHPAILEYYGGETKDDFLELYEILEKHLILL